MDFILRACGLRRDGDAPPPPPRRLPPSEPVARRLRFRRQVRLPANPLLDLPVDVLEHCARLGELRTFHGLVVVLGHSRRPTAVALKRIVRDDRLSPSPLFRDAREVEMTYTHTPPYSNTTGEREEYCIGDSKLKTSPLHRCLVALTEAAWAGDYEVYDDDDEEIPDGILAARRAAAMQQVGATAVYHGVASIEGTNEDVGGYETVALLSVARREARCLPGAVEPPRVLFAVCTAQSTPGFFGHDGQIYRRFGVYAMLGPEPANERRAALVDAAWELLDPEGTGFVERAGFFDAFDASRHPHVLEERTGADEEEEWLTKWYAKSAGVDRADHVSRREFQTLYAERSEDAENDEAFERELDVWTAGETLSVESSSDPAAPSPLRPCSRLVRLVHASLPQTVLNPYNGDDHEHIHTATAETCAAVAEQLGVDVESLGYVIKAVALAANLRGTDGREWKDIESISEDADARRSNIDPALSEFCDTFPHFGRDIGRRTGRECIEYPLGEDLFYYRYDPPTFEGRKAADHELSFGYESAHGLLRQAVAEVSTRVDLEACASLETLHDKLRGWREVVRARLRRQHPAVLQEWEEGPVQDHFAFEYSTQHWRGV